MEKKKKETQTELLGMETAVSEIKNIFDMIWQIRIVEDW